MQLKDARSSPHTKHRLKFPSDVETDVAFYNSPQPANVWLHTCELTEGRHTTPLQLHYMSHPQADSVLLLGLRHGEPGTPAQHLAPAEQYKQVSTNGQYQH